MLVTMVCEFPKTCWFAINSQAPVESLPRIITPVINEASNESIDVTLRNLNKNWDKIYSGWNARPDKPGFLDKTMAGLVLEGVEYVIDVQIEILNDIRHEKYKNENLYTDVERERVESIGFRPIYSPGGFKI